jgi:hypothetical protein
MRQSSEADPSGTLENRNKPGIWKARSWLLGGQVDQFGWPERSMQQRPATGLPVFFAHPHSPWERGSNEYLNRIVREFFSKGVASTSDPRLSRDGGFRNQRPAP